MRDAMRCKRALNQRRIQYDLAIDMAVYISPISKFALGLIRIPKSGKMAKLAK